MKLLATQFLNHPHRKGYSFLSFYLVLVFIFNSVNVVTSLLFLAKTQALYPNHSVHLLAFSALLSTINCIAVIAMWRWHRWGIGLYIASVLTSAGLTYWLHQQLSQTAMALSGILILSVLLSLGGPQKAWGIFLK